MTHGIVLAVHIIVACATVVTLSYAGYALLRGTSARYKLLAKIIPSLAVVETISGFLLTVLSPDLSVAKVGLHLLLYLSVCLAFEAALVFRMQKVWIG